MKLSKLKEYNLKDTIAAIATFPSTSALGVIKISGKKALEVTSQMFIPKKKNKDIRKAKTYTMHYGWIVDKRSKTKQQEVDEVLVSIMKGPHSYTTDDVVEISSHGGRKWIGPDRPRTDADCCPSCRVGLLERHGWPGARDGTFFGGGLRGSAWSGKRTSSAACDEIQSERGSGASG